MADWKQAFANDAEKALDHEMVKGVMDEFKFNLNGNPDVAKAHFESGLFRYGFAKCMMYVATVARAQALGIDPELLRLTPTEATEQQMKLAEMAARAGKPVFMIEADELGEER